MAQDELSRFKDRLTLVKRVLRYILPQLVSNVMDLTQFLTASQRISPLNMSKNKKEKEKERERERRASSAFIRFSPSRSAKNLEMGNFYH